MLCLETVPSDVYLIARSSYSMFLPNSIATYKTKY